jgi:uncharacterized membrane protein (DUF485 family)
VRPTVQLLVLAGAFAAGTLVAELAGAADLGTAMAFGQIAFCITLVTIMVLPSRT